jgi:hexosaminidase
VARDEANFRRAGVVEGDRSAKTAGVCVQEFTAELENTPVRFIRVIGKNRAVCPAGHPGAGKMAWIFTDEIVIR